MTSPGSGKIGLYIIVALCAMLLAPYAGCHILTKQPSERGFKSDEGDSKLSAAREPGDHHGEEPVSEAGESSASSLSDIEELLPK